jgi:hypothetical protein
VCAAIALPLAAFWLAVKHGSLFHLGERRNDARANLGYVLIFPSSILALCAGIDPHYVNWLWFLLPAVTCGVVFSVFALSAKEELPSRRTVALVLFFFGAILFWAASAELDTILDKSPVKSFEADVLSKRVSRGGKRTTYYLKLAPWGPVDQAKDTAVSSGVYASAQSGGRVCVVLHPGAFGVPWYEIRPCR